MSVLHAPAVAAGLKEKPVVSWQRLLSFPVMLSALLAFLTFHTCSPRFDDPDLWWHLRTGDKILSEKSIPRIDSYSFTAAGNHWVAQEWLAETVLAITQQGGGSEALFTLFAVTASAIVILGYCLCSLWSGNPKTALLGGVIVLFFLTAGLTIRPALFGFLFIEFELLVLYDWLYSRGRHVWLLPVLMAVWVNTHASFFFGMALLFLAAIFQIKRGQIRQSILICTLTLAAACINPQGPVMLLYPLEVMFRQPDNLGNIQEWAPLSLAEPRAWAWMAVLLFLGTAQVRGWIRLHTVEWLLIGIGVAMSVQHVRMLPIFGMLSAPVVCRVIAGWWEQYAPEKDQPLMNALLIAAALWFCTLLQPTTGEIESAIAANEPVAAVSAIRRLGLTGPLLNDYIWGGYLIWALPEHKVFIDGRADLYAPLGIMREFGRWVMLEEDPALLLERRKIRTILVRQSAPVARVLRYMPGWTLAYEDEMAAVFQKS